MPKAQVIVINTSPLISLVAALGSLEVLNVLYEEVIVPFAVCEEILKSKSKVFAQSEFQQATGN